MTTITIPKELVKKGDLIIIPRKEYDEFIEWHKFIKSFKTFTPTAAEKRIIKRAQENYKKSNFIEWEKLRDELDNSNRLSSRKTA